MFTSTPKALSLTLAIAATIVPAQAKSFETSATSAPGCFEAPAPAPRPVPRPGAVEGCAEAPRAPAPAPLAVTRSKMFHLLRYHQAFPAGRSRVLDAARSSLELTTEEQAWLAARLPTGVTFTSGAEVLRVLFPSTPAAVLARLDAGPTTLAHR